MEDTPWNGFQNASVAVLENRVVVVCSEAEPKGGGSGEGIRTYKRKVRASGIAFRFGDADKGVSALSLWCVREKIPFRFFRREKDVPDGWLPFGNVLWTEAILGRRLMPDYLPEFLKGFVFRKTWPQDKWPLGQVCHVKPLERYKRFTGFVTRGTWKGAKKGPLLCSEPVTFLNEWRFYVANGVVLAAHWYWGDQEKTPDAPEIGVSWPTMFCGSVDFGQRDDGRIELIEAHHPIACGWYGSLNDGAVFAQWLDEGWASLRP